MRTCSRYARSTALLLCALVFSLFSAQVSHAAQPAGGAKAGAKKNLVTTAPQQKVLAIIDTGLDGTATDIYKNIVSEACVSHNASCPNGQNFMAGAGAATLPAEALHNSTFAHGTEVVSSAIAVNKNVQILEVRCSSIVEKSKWEGCTYDDIATALDWLNQNHAQLNLGAVVLPMATTPSSVCDIDVKNQNLVAQLAAVNIPVIASSGNNGIYDGVSNPACIPGVLAISATDSTGAIATYANYSARVDFAYLGEFNVTTHNNRTVFAEGTSLAAGAFGSQWLALQASHSLNMSDENAWISSHAKAAAAPVGTDTVKVLTADVLNVAR